MTTNTKIIYRDPQDLTIHPLVAALPMFGPHTHEMEELRTRIDTFGWEEITLCIDEEGLLFDGRHTRLLALEQGIEAVRCQVYATEEVPARIKALGMGRTHLSKGGKAYWWWPFYAALAMPVGGNQHTKKRVGNDYRPSDESLTMEEIAKEIGVSVSLVQWAKKAHAYFEKYPERRAEMEPKILTGEIGLNRVECANGRNPYDEGGADLSGRGDHYTHALTNFEKASQHVVKGWQQMDAVAKGRLAEKFSEVLDKWPEELQTTLLKALRTITRRGL